MLFRSKVQFLLCHAHDSVKSRLDHANYPVRVLNQEFLIPVCAANTQGKPQHPMETDGLLPMLEYSETSGLGRILKAALAPEWEKWMKKQSRTTHSVVFSAPHSFLLKAMALAGKGVAWLPQSLVMNELDQGSLILAAGEDWHVPVQIRLYRQKSELTPIAESVWSRVQA